MKDTSAPEGEPISPWRRPVLVFALVIQTLGLIPETILKGQFDKPRLIALGYIIAAVSLSIAVLSPLFARGPFRSRLRYALFSFGVWIVFSVGLAIFGLLFLGVPLQD